MTEDKDLRALDGLTQARIDYWIPPKKLTRLVMHNSVSTATFRQLHVDGLKRRDRSSQMLAGVLVAILLAAGATGVVLYKRVESSPSYLVRIEP
jgi:hypothetical protein